MWTFDNPPRAAWKERYGFEPDAAWLDHLRLSVVRLVEPGSSGTASFVSPDGLILTNQHVAVGCVAEGVDRLARLRQVGLLRENTRRRVEVSRSVRRCARLVRERHGPRPRGGAGWRKRCGCREGAANGDDRDRARVARAHRPAVGRPRALQRRRILAVPLQAVHRPPPGVRARGADGVFRRRLRQLHVSPARPRRRRSCAPTRTASRRAPSTTCAGRRAASPRSEFVVLAGYPGTTDRLLTVTQIRYQRDIGNPLQKHVWTARRDALAAFASTGAEAARRANAPIRSLENSLKRLEGPAEGHREPRGSWKRKSRKSWRCDRPWRRTRRGRRRTAMPGRASTPLIGELPAMASRIAFSTLTPSTAANHAVLLARYADGPDGQSPHGPSLLSDAPLYPGSRGGDSRGMARRGEPRARGG